MAIQKGLKPPTARSLIRQNGKEPHRVTSTLTPTKAKKVN